MASSSTLRFADSSLWGTWGPKRTCPKGEIANSYSQRVEDYRKFILFDNTALNSICLRCRNGYFICSKKGYWGTWATSPTSNDGFDAANLKIDRHQGNKVDDMGAKDFQVYNSGVTYSARNGRPNGIWMGTQYCPSGQRICGIQTRVSGKQGKYDDIALSGVILQCCKKDRYY